MSDDLVNQITLNFLISKQQLQKLNKKIKQKEEDKMKTDMEIYKDKIVELFNQLLDEKIPSDLLEDVKHSYTYFVEKSIYYLKMKESSNTEFIEADKEEYLEQEDDEDQEEDEEDLEAQEEHEDEEEEDLESEEDEDLEENEIVTKELTNTFKTQSTAIKKTVYKKFANTKSKGVDDIQQLPLDWFSKVRQTYKQNQIIPRHKDNEVSKDVVLESPTNYKNTEKKNINRLYEDKTNDKNKKTKQ
jgi:hypothetical protein